MNQRIEISTNYPKIRMKFLLTSGLIFCYKIQLALYENFRRQEKVSLTASFPQRFASKGHIYEARGVFDTHSSFEKTPRFIVRKNAKIHHSKKRQDSKVSLLTI